LRDEYTRKDAGNLRFQGPELDAEWGGQQAEGEGDRQEDEFQDAVDGYADEAEKQEQQPDEWVG
jgi:hypothetical protein